MNRTRVLPGVPGIWIFILLDMLFFSVLFLAYGMERARQPQLFAAAQAQLNVALGLCNMLVLLTSSWLVAQAVHAIRLGRTRAGKRLLVAALCCALVFAAVKLVEYGQEFSRGITPLTDSFFTLYFSLTFFHFLHVLAGSVVLAILARNTGLCAYDSGRTSGLETGATYWHMVDLIWIMLFPLLYLAK
ncbi:cytochrome c oxidase subunit 3 family protein [Pseudomonas sp. Bout1]|uniref:cytochrome c oxidase subunit 3 family protein n=1 Tax=unclassified Pseudomonas TaxID=196821 RepID=UPI002AB33F57|nr:cytochrome c oxidase subunit 3 family protein [Pseudomonas sp. Bout1]MDY7533074.1 cytochrome c oxidase subunit 3 family protein [Pseudomonas sp. Bout1]MEB0184445.1 cytochrome c oxidase subunit 3 family protein [Pseudomonas sp. Bout1]